MVFKTMFSLIIASVLFMILMLGKLFYHIKKIDKNKSKNKKDLIKLICILTKS
jgi:anionic cell wall polymer biosynthesis LytR-Cps2A-Psr (LCP) family protein